MNKGLKRSLMAAGVAMALGTAGVAQAQFVAGPIGFDRTGQGGAGEAVAIDQFDWSAGTILAKGLQTSTTSDLGGGELATVTTGNAFTLFSQGTLGTFIQTSGVGLTSGSGLSATYALQEFTFELIAAMKPDPTAVSPAGGFASGTAGGTGAGLSSVLDTGVSGTKFFKVWVDLSMDAPAAASRGSSTVNQFGAGDLQSCDKAANDAAATDGSKLILCGIIVDGEMSFNQTTVAPAIRRLDAVGSNNYDGGAPTDGQGPETAIDSMAGTGSSSFDVNIAYYDPNYFLSTLGGFSVDLVHGDNNGLNFDTVTPHQRVVGHTWDVGTDKGGGSVILNNMVCRDNIAAGANTCDTVFQGDAKTTFQQVPEPASLALLGLGLGMLGFGVRRRRSA